MKIGYFCNPWNIGHERDYRDILNEVRELAQFCEQAGFDNFWLAEHHFSIWGREMLPNPLLMATDLAARTSRIRIGLAAAIITFWHPLRLAEDIALLDQLCDGRLEFGVGRGNYGLEGLNLNPKADPNNPADNFGVFADTINIVKEALSKSRFRYDGAKYTIPYPGFKTDQAHPVNHPDYVDPETGELRYISTYPRPRQTPYPPLWQVVDSPSSIEFAAKNDLGIIMWRPPVEALRERCGLYRESARSVGVELPFGARTGISRDVHIAPSREEARRIAGKWVMDALNFSNWRGPRIFLKPGETFAPGQEEALKKKLSFEFVDERSLIFGPPEYAIEKFAELRDDLNLEQVNMKMGWPGMGQREILRSLELFAERVLPELQRDEAAAPSAAALEAGTAA